MKSPFSVRLSTQKKNLASSYSTTLIMSGITLIQNSHASTCNNFHEATLENKKFLLLHFLQVFHLGAYFKWLHQNGRKPCLDDNSKLNLWVFYLGALIFGAIQPSNSYCIGSIISIYFIDDNSKLSPSPVVQHHLHTFRFYLLLCQSTPTLQSWESS